jgi:hypothetical protein
VDYDVFQQPSFGIIPGGKLSIFPYEVHSTYCVEALVSKNQTYMVRYYYYMSHAQVIIESRIKILTQSNKDIKIKTFFCSLNTSYAYYSYVKLDIFQDFFWVVKNCDFLMLVLHFIGVATLNPGNK